MASIVQELISRRGTVKCLTLNVTAASDGTVADKDITRAFSGLVLAFQTDPGSPAPTDNYDVTLVDANGYDVLQGLGANRDTANTERVVIVHSGTEIHPCVSSSDDLTFKVANNSVNGAKLQAKIYFLGEWL